MDKSVSSNEVSPAFTSPAASRNPSEYLQKPEDYQVLVERNAVGIWHINAAGQTLSINPTMLQMLELDSAEDLKNITYHQFFSAEALAIVESEHEIRKHGIISSYATEIIGRKGRKLDVLVYGTPLFGPDGSLESMVGTFLDNTVRREAEKALQRQTIMLEATSDFIGTADATGRALYVNKAGRRMAGIPEDADISRYTISDFYPEWTYKFFKETALPAAIRDGIWQGETALKGAHGEEIPLSQVIIVHKSRNGTVELISTIARDIGEQKRFAEALQKSEELFRAIVQDQTELIVRCKPDGTLLFVNQAYARFFQKSPEELIGKNFYNFIAESDRAAIRKKYLELTPSNPVATDIHRTLRPDGTICWQEWMDHGFFDNQGNVLELQSVGRDISDRVRAEDALRKSEENYRTLVETSSDLIWSVDLEGTITFINQACTQIYNYTPEEMIGRHFNDFIFAENAAADQEAFRVALESGRNINYESKVRHKDGSIIYLSTNAVAVRDAAGNACGVMGISKNITARILAEQALRESEQRLRQLAETVDQVLWLSALDPERALYISPSFSKIWSRSPDAFYDDARFWQKSIHPDDQQRVRDVFQGWLNDENDPTYNAEYRIIRADGSIRWISDTGSKIRNEEGKVYRICGVARDITETKRAEETQASLEAKLHQSQKMDAVGRLAGGIAHDFNNILTAISGNAKMAGQDLPKDHPIREHLNEIEKSANRATELVRQILTFGRQQEMERTPLNLVPVVEDAVRFLKAALPASIEIRSQFRADLPFVSANATQIHQAIMNLGTNGCHAMNGHGVLEISLNEVMVDAEMAKSITDLRPGKCVCLSVRDSGEGISSGTLEHIFEPFFTTKTQGQGTGLGLSVVHGIMQTHGGAIQVETERGHGSTFHLYFPVVAAPVPSAPSKKPDDFRGEGQRILFVDDEQAIVFITTRMLKKLGYEVTGFTNPREALAAFQADPDHFDIVVTDMSMPYMDGPRLIGELQKIRSDIPIIMATGYIRSQDIESAKTLGIAELILKPNTISELGQSLHNILSKRGGGKAADSLK